MSEATFYKYKAKYGGMTVSDARKLKALEDENARLKRLLRGPFFATPQCPTRAFTTLIARCCILDCIVDADVHGNPSASRCCRPQRDDHVRK